MNETQAFKDLNIPEGLKAALHKMGFETLTPIQAKTIGPALLGRDLLGSSQTGTGKTAAYAIPILAWIYLNPGRQALILVPTRELATQIHKVLRQMGKAMNLKGCLILGGESFARQKSEANGDADYLIATPGRLSDHLAQNSLTLDRVSMFILDEVDLMMDLGFSPSVIAIADSLPKNRQTLFFSATLPSATLSLSQSLLKNPVHATVGVITQPIYTVEHVNRKVMSDRKPELLLKEVSSRTGSILVFTRTKPDTEKIAKFLAQDGHLVDFLHGERTQRQRKEALARFRSGECRILVATDIAARGLDIPAIEHVINYHLPQTRDEYIHRVGRTGRQGKKGIAVNFITPRDSSLLRKIGKVIGMDEPLRDRAKAPSQKYKTSKHKPTDSRGRRK